MSLKQEKILEKNLSESEEDENNSENSNLNENNNNKNLFNLKYENFSKTDIIILKSIIKILQFDSINFLSNSKIDLEIFFDKKNKLMKNLTNDLNYIIQKNYILFK